MTTLAELMRTPVSTGHYEIYPAGGLIGTQWRWRFRANNGRIVASGEAYYNFADCQHAVDLLKASGTAEVRQTKM